ncbi:MAG: branched-chain amino acid ABC transporter permease/ATP-binding protein [Acidimicrobiales bacterium]
MVVAALPGLDAVAHGVVLGLVYGVLGVGLVLVYRASGVVNFAYGETGALGAAVLAKLVLDEHWSWFLALPSVLVLGAAMGAATQLLVARRLAGRPKVALLTATIGLSQLLLVAQLLLPRIREIAPFPTPVHRHLRVGSVVVAGPDFVAIALVPAMVVGLALWLTRTPMGRALAAAGDNEDAAVLAGIRTGHVALAAWAIGGALATATAVLANPIQGVIVGRPTEALGAGLLVRALAAGLVGRLRSLPIALVAGIGIGVVQGVADSGSVDPALADVAVLIVVLGALIVRRTPSAGRPTDGALVPVAPVPRRGARAAGSAWAAACVAAAVLVPLVAGRSSQLFFFSRVALYAVVGLSLVILTGWAGQLSLGQFALVGVGTFTVALLGADGVPFWAAVPVGAALGAGVSVLVGIPALRARGLELGIATLALAVAARSWLFTRSSLLGPGGVVTAHRGHLLWLDLRGPVAYYEVCVVVLVASSGMAMIIRRGRLGRSLLAVRTNERRAASLGLSPPAVKLVAFALAGGLAGLAGSLLLGLRVRSGPGDFGPEESIRMLAITVIGGAGSPAGAVVGAVVILGIPALFGSSAIAALLPSGIGLMVLVLLAPGGLAQLGSRVRLAVGYGPGTLMTRIDPTPAGGRSGSGAASGEVTPRAHASSLEVDGVSVSFGGRVALDSVAFGVAPSEVVGLIGANGAGKSTLLDVISGFTSADAGSVRLDGRDLAGMSPAARARGGVGRVFQDARLFDDLTVAEAVGLAAGGRSQRERADEVIWLLGLEAAADTQCQALSTGLRRLGEVACTIVRGPSLVLLDEPTAGLAQRESEAFAPLLRGVHDSLGSTIVLVEHDIALVRAVADRVVCLSAGRVLADGAPGSVLADPAVVSSYLGAAPAMIDGPPPTGLGAPG